MASSDLESFLSKGIVFSTNNRFSGLLKPAPSGLKKTVAGKSSSSPAKMKKESSVKIIQTIKSNKSTL